jgi:hypothetical protein
MINLLLAMVLCLSSLVQATEDGAESEVNLRFFKNVSSKLRVLTEFKTRKESENNKIRGLSFGAYYRVLESLKVGFFYTKAYGQLHNEDWIWVDANWGWRNTDSRAEEMYTLDLTWRTILASNTVFELKNRFTVNDFNNHRFYRVRPGITYFWKKDSMPFINWFFQYELYLPENDYSDETIYERWGYVGMLYHLHSEFKVGAFVSRKRVTWTNKEVKSNVFALNLYYFFK